MAEPPSHPIRGLAEFLSIAAHEMKTPVAVIRGSVKLLLEAQATQKMEERKQLLEGIDKHCAQLNGILDELATVARLGEKMLAPKRETLDLIELIRGLAPQFPTLAFDASGKQPVTADPDFTKELLARLFSNVRQEGESSVAVAFRREPHMLQVRIGGGGPRRAKDLGLTVAKMLINSMGGTITEEETAVTFALPSPE